MTREIIRVTSLRLSGAGSAGIGALVLTASQIAGSEITQTLGQNPLLNRSRLPPLVETLANRLTGRLVATHVRHAGPRCG